MMIYEYFHFVLITITTRTRCVFIINTEAPLELEGGGSSAIILQTESTEEKNK